MAPRVKNTRGKTRKADKPYETYTWGNWTWYVLRHYKAAVYEKKDPYARVMTLVITPMTGAYGDMGDTYCKDIPGYDYDWED